MNLLKALNRSLPATVIFNIALFVLWFSQVLLLENFSENMVVTVFGNMQLLSLPMIVGAVIQLFLFFFLAFWTTKSLFSPYLNITYLPFSLIMALGAVWRGFHFFSEATVAMFFLIFALNQFLKINPHKSPSAKVLNIFLSLTAASFFVPEFAIFIPIFVIGLFYFYGGNFKLLSAILFSIISPILCFLSVCYLTDRIDIFTNFYQTIFQFDVSKDFSIYLLPQYSLIILLIVYSLISLFLYFSSSAGVKIHIRRLLTFLVILWLTTLLSLLIFWHNLSSFAMLNIIMFAFFATLNFVDFRKLRNQILFYVLIFVLFGVYVLQFFL
jgi:hypothetical protein